MSDYDTNFGVRTDHPVCRIVVRFDKRNGVLERFAVQLQESDLAGDNWGTIAQIDHAPNDAGGHDLYAEGLHVDVYQEDGSTLKVYPRHGTLPQSSGALLRICSDYLEDHISWFRAVCAGNRDPDDPPKF